ncbi:winged helix-turn-helix transcriptional regulator [Saccharothrix variisporea]|uniref:HxlR family transcriptional regulator n=1 Tax=Saccharothrix variisporea TaxID=543527 RepID=A0A495X6Y0_9PSEU|nr:helix-turn-helix domain-containing protein [Saccharothrix variisporea]RKT68774.1 HxlR family transcriptional regulator [Saccharothrix variisporea]
MNRDRFTAMACSVARTSGLIGDPWTLLVLRDLFLGLTRFDELHRDLGVATNVLSDRLDRLMSAGLVERKPYQRNPVRYRYELTEPGKELYGVVLSLLAWGDRYMAVDGAPMELVHRDCGELTTPLVTCDNCGGELHVDDVEVRPGPGGRHAPGTVVIAELLTGHSGS